jgi:hypothetical protein
MESLLALILVASLVVHPALLTAQEQPLAAAIAREARSVAVMRAPAEGQSASDWSRVMRLSGGIDVSITTSGGSAVTRTTVAATSDTPFVLDLQHRGLSRALREALRDTAEKSAMLLVRTATVGARLEFDSGKVGTLGPEGIVIGGRKVAELSEVLVATPAGDVVLIDRPIREQKGKGAAAAVAGGLGGALAGSIIGSLFTRNCHCDDPGLEGAVYGFWMGIPVGATLAYRSTATLVRETIYHR